MFLARGGLADRAGQPTLQAALSPRPGGATAGAAPGSAGQVYTIGIHPDPDRGGRDDDVGDLEDFPLPRRGHRPRTGSGSGPGGQDELWPGVAPPVPYPGATGEVLHGKWVTFHEGPALLL